MKEDNSGNIHGKLTFKHFCTKITKPIWRKFIEWKLIDTKNFYYFEKIRNPNLRLEAASFEIFLILCFVYLYLRNGGSNRKNIATHPPKSYTLDLLNASMLLYVHFCFCKKSFYLCDFFSVTHLWQFVWEWKKCEIKQLNEQNENVSKKWTIVRVQQLLTKLMQLIIKFFAEICALIELWVLYVNWGGS